MPSVLPAIPAARHNVTASTGRLCGRWVLGHVTSALTVLAVGVALPSARAQTQIGPTILGASASDRFGYALSARDLDGDGRPELLVGAPYNNDNGRAYVYEYNLQLNTWNILAQVSIGAAQQDRFGWSVDWIGDLNNDGKPEYAVGAPYDDPNGWTNAGSVWVYNGSTHQPMPNLSPFPGPTVSGYAGQSIAGAGDLDGDGKPDLLVGAPGASRVHIVSGATGVGTLLLPPPGSPNLFGVSVARGVDLDGDQVPDFVVGALSSFNTITRAYVFSGDTRAVLFAVTGNYSSGGFGTSVAFIGDTNGDGKSEFAVGEPYSQAGGSGAGEVYVFSGADGSLRYRLKGAPSARLGLRVSSAGDVDRDGYADLIAAGYNAAHVYSGFMGTLLYSFAAPYEAAVAAAGDVNGDGIPDFAVGFPNENTAIGNLSGAVRVYSASPIPVVTYCTAKTASPGCVPAVSGTGVPTTQSGVSFHIRAANVVNQKNGILFYGFAPNAAPFQDGVLCVRQPIARTPVQNSGGLPDPPNCSGTFALDFNQLIASGANPSLTATRVVFAQYWFRDPGSASTTGLSDAVEFEIRP